MITKTGFLDALSSRVLIGDGAMGTQLQSFDLDVDKDFLGLEGCNEILNDTRPDVLRQIHRAYFDAGAEVVETNTPPFYSNKIRISPKPHQNHAKKVSKSNYFLPTLNEKYQSRFCLNSYSKFCFP